MPKRTGNYNSKLHAAKRAKNDEFYTQLKDIENELCHYESQLKGKVIFCNCDDPAESNFFLYFIMKFKKLKLKGIIATHYVPEGKSYKIEVWNDDMAKRIEDTIKYGYDFNSEINRKALQSLKVITPLQENGDFRSPECIELLQKSDMVITNPPFSLFREYVAQLMEYEKKFLVIGHINAITYKENFPLIRANKLWMGVSISSGDREFIVPSHCFMEIGNHRTDENGIHYARVMGVRWFTNLDHAKRHEELTLYKQYTPEEYPKYDNYDAIEVSKVVTIPLDFGGVMGVPISFLDKYNPEQFEIVGMSSSAGFNAEIVGIPFLGEKDARPLINGKNTYARILIRKKRQP